MADTHLATSDVARAAAEHAHPTPAAVALDLIAQERAFVVVDIAPCPYEVLMSYLLGTPRR